MFGKLFRRKREPEDPKAVAERNRRLREEEEYRRKAEVDRGRQESEIHNYLPGGP